MNFTQRYGLWFCVATILTLLVLLNVALFVNRHKQNAQFSKLTRYSLKTPAVVPKRLFQTYHCRNLPARMQRTVDHLRADHPDFEYVFHTDAESYQFLQQHFPPKVAAAYETLVPGAFKADLWRLCVLYKLGGVYLDIKFYCWAPFTFHALLDGPHFARDVRDHGIYNAVMVSPPGDPRIKQCIDAIVHNVETRNYGRHQLDVTGPMLVARFIDPKGPDVDMRLRTLLYYNDIFVTYRGPPRQTILKAYYGYRQDQRRTQVKKRYKNLWKARQIFKNS
jgi:hypothetical protein